MHTTLELLRINQRTQSRFLDLGNCGLTGTSYEVWSELSYMTWIEYLNLGEWFWSEWGYRDSTQNRGMKNTLNRIPSEITRLWNLKGLYLYDNPIHDIFPLLRIQQLTFLDLSYTRIHHLQHLGNLHRLKKLSLMGLELTDMSHLKMLNHLEELLLAYTRIEDLSCISALKNLFLLSLNESNVQEIDALRSLQKLTHLYLRNIRTQDFSPLTDLQALVELDLSENKSIDLSCIQHLPNLLRLGLNRMEIEQYPDSFFFHTSIKELYTTGTTIAEVPPELLSKREGENCFPRIRDYHLSRQQGSEKVLEAKLILVGNGRVGKTCIVDAMLGNEFEENEKSTHGIQLSIWEEIEIDGNKVKINIWDFAGQDIYHSTHQLFMRTRALYLLVWDLETENSTSHEYEGYSYQNHPILYWLEYINRISGCAPIILVQNKIDRDGKQSPPGINLLQQKYPIVDILEVSARTQIGIRRLKLALEEAFAELPEVRQAPTIPQSWSIVSKRLAAIDKPAIELHEYHQICDESGINLQAGTISKSLLEYLHHTGFLFYQEGMLKDQIILDQSWMIKAIYTLFDREEIYHDLLVAQKGSFHRDDLSKIWSQHPENEQSLFLSFMEQCEICFRLDWNIYLIPQLLPREPAQLINRFWESGTKDDIYVKLTFSFLHRSIVDRFLVRIGSMAKEEEIWRNGIWWQDPWLETDALVNFHIAQHPKLSQVHPYQGNVHIRLRGIKIKAMLDRILREFNRIEPDQVPDIKVSLDHANFIRLDLLKDAYKAELQTLLSEEGNKVHIGKFVPLIIEPQKPQSSAPLNESINAHMLREQLEAAQLREVLTQLKPKAINSAYNNQIYQLLGRLSNLEHERDLIDSRDYRVEWNRISYTCLMIIEGLAEEGKLAADYTD